MLERVLIANRGEIACRVITACRRLGVASVAVHSDADRSARHVRLADQAMRLGPAPAAESYLRQDRLLAAAAETGADAVHPGYGFLSENAAFARAVRKAGLAWVGPPPEAMDRMGDKVAARAEAEKAGVPVAPGSASLSDVDAAREAAASIGYPIILKASAGGGGIGMRIVHTADELEEAFQGCRAQAKAAFGVADVFAEKYLERPRHIEVQVLADQHGHAIHLGERECSIQRRHQKLLEEAPSPALDAEARKYIGDRSVDLAKQVGYENAGTLEFLWQDGHSSRDASGDAPESSTAGGGQFYFNEMNTRLQVEHPVTEMVTGVDLVAWQLRIAAGERLAIQQDDVRLDGHAIELRVNAEDPWDGFRPSPGTVRGLKLPTGAGIRVDHGLRDGWAIPAVYDSMVLKLIGHGRDRAEATARLRDALCQLDVTGVTTNRAFHERLLRHPDFVAGDLSTRFLEEHDVMRGATATDATADRARVASIVVGLESAPGGGLAGHMLRQRRPHVVEAPRRRDWEAW